MMGAIFAVQINDFFKILKNLYNFCNKLCDENGNGLVVSKIKSINKYKTINEKN